MLGIIKKQLHLIFQKDKMQIKGMVCWFSKEPMKLWNMSDSYVVVKFHECKEKFSCSLILDLSAFSTYLMGENRMRGVRARLVTWHTWTQHSARKSSKSKSFIHIKRKKFTKCPYLIWEDKFFSNKWKKNCPKFPIFRQFSAKMSWLRIE